MGIAAIVALILQNIPSLIADGQSVISLVNSIKTALQQTGEWTADMEVQFQAALLSNPQPPQWTPDPTTLSGNAAYSLAQQAKQAPIPTEIPKSAFVVISEQTSKGVPASEQVPAIVPLSPVQAPVSAPCTTIVASGVIVNKYKLWASH